MVGFEDGADDGQNAATSQTSILSAKVSRALEVRSDTAAMKAALDALAHLPDHQDDLFTIDSRSVRVAIEQDALQQALMLQDQLKILLSTVSDLRKGVTETAAIAHRVEEAIHTNVITAAVESHAAGIISDTAEESKDSSASGPDSDPLAPPPLSSDLMGADPALQQEQKLAGILFEAFAQRNAAKKRVETVHEFLEKFDLSEEDSRLLDHYSFEDVETTGPSTTTVNGLAFLEALDRVRTIRHELGQSFGSGGISDPSQKVLETARSPSDNTSRLGASSALRMMESLAQKQERAYERLYHWLQKFLRVHGNEGGANQGFEQPPDEDYLDEALSHPFVRKSIACLRNVPAFHSHLLELIASSRRSEETRRFLLALTSGYQGLPPIEMRAHDSVVYVGDMLAFCFRAFSVEADVARGLLDSSLAEEDEEEGDRTTDVANAKISDIPEESDFMVDRPITASEMLSQSMGGVSRPLKARVLQVVANLSRRPTDEDDDSEDGLGDSLEEEGAAIRNRLAQLYEICGLLLFYVGAMEKSITKIQSANDPLITSTNDEEEEQNPLLRAMLDCLVEAASAYEASLRVYGAMLEQLNVLTGDSEASLAHAMIVRIAEVRNSSPGFAADVVCPEAQRQSLSLDWACEVLIDAALPSSKTLDDTVSLRQSISVAHKSELTSSLSASLEEKVMDRETALIDVLVEKETADVLDLCGLGVLVTAFERFLGVQVEGMVMATHPGLSPDEVQTAMSEFYTSLYSPPLPSFESSIKDPTLRKLARNKIASNVCKAYASLYDAMSRPDQGGYDDLSFLGHTPQQVNTLFAA